MEKAVKKDFKENKFKKFWRRFWEIVWKDDSFKGWIISLVFLFVVIKLIFFPLLNLVTGTQLPLAIVESCSMYHKGDIIGNFDDWFTRHENKYENLGITKSQFEDFKMKKGFNKGDILFITGVNPDKVKIGDIIIFNADQRTPIIHRVVNITLESQTGERIFSTMGDNNNGQLVSEVKIHESQLVGKATLRLVPLIGWGKLIFFESKKPVYERGFCNEN
jgi:signal peptidase I